MLSQLTDREAVGLYITILIITTIHIILITICSSNISNNCSSNMVCPIFSSLLSHVIFHLLLILLQTTIRPMHEKTTPKLLLIGQQELCEH